MKKRIIAVIVILAVLVALFFIGTGFQKRMDVVLVAVSYTHLEILCQNSSPGTGLSGEYS